jgi:hypothetical protein
MRISFGFISPLLSFHLYSFRRGSGWLIQILERGGEGVFLKIKKLGQFFYENCSILYKMSFSLTRLQIGENHMIIGGYDDSKVWYKKCYSKITFLG